MSIIKFYDRVGNFRFSNHIKNMTPEYCQDIKAYFDLGGYCIANNVRISCPITIKDLYLKYEGEPLPAPESEIQDLYKAIDTVPASEALAMYAEKTESNECETEITVTAFLADIMHICAQEGIDFEERLEIATKHFNAELIDNKNLAD